MGDESRDGPVLPEDIFNDALEMAGEARSKFLDQACAGRPDLRHQIERMLARVDSRPDLIAPPEATPIPEFLGKYQILSECGRGGMGIVYQARDTQLERTIALKVLPAGIGRDQRSLDRFQREARLLAALNDERIAILHSLEQSQGIHFLTMEFVAGETLAGVLSKVGTLSVGRTVDLGCQIAQALETAHAQSIIHRDLKPANIMVTESGRIKILDFGIGKVLDSIPEAGMAGQASSPDRSVLQGTPSYMSPEQALGGKVDHRCDLWALGCLLFECLTGRKAFPPGEGAGATREWLREPEWSALPKETPKEIRLFLRSCLQVDPQHRLDSSSSAHRTLSKTLAVSNRSPLRRWLVPGLIGVVLAAFLTGAWLWRRPGKMAALEVLDGRKVRAADQRGAVVWIREFPGEVMNNKQRGSSAAPLTVVRESQNEVGVAISTWRTGIPAMLWFLDPRDGRTIWSKTVRWAQPLSQNQQIYVPWTAQVDWPGERRPVLAIGIRDGIWYNAAVRFLTVDGTELGTYYHPGPLLFPGLDRPDPSTDHDVLLYGLNGSARFVRAIVPFETRMHIACLVLLEPPFISGQAFPYSEGIPEGRDWPGMERAQEKNYLLIPPLHAGRESRVSQVEYRPGNDGHPGYQVLLDDGRVYGLGADLNPQSLYISIKSAADSLRSAGDLRLLPLHYFSRGKRESVEVPYSL